MTLHFGSSRWTPRTAVVFAGVLIALHSAAYPQAKVWQQMEFPQQYGGSIFGMMETPGHTLYATTYQDGLVRSTDGGSTWKQVFSFESYTPAIAYTSAGAVFCGTGDGGGLRRSTDDGATWTIEGPNPSGGSIRGIIATSQDHLFVCDVADSSIDRSTDGGSSWTRLTGGIPATFIPAEVITNRTPDKDTLYMTGLDYSTYQCSLFRSTDDGNTWLHLSTQGFIARLFAHTNGSVFFLCEFGITRSLDGGSTWDVIVPYNYHIRGMVELTDRSILAGNTTGAPLRSTDNGESWIPMHNPGAGASFCVLQAHDGTIFSGTEWTGLFASTDGGAGWSQRNTGFPRPAARIQSIAGLGDGSIGASADLAGLLVSGGGTGPWQRKDPGPWNETGRLAPRPDGIVLAATVRPENSGAPMMRSTDRGSTWDTTYLAPPGPANLLVASDVAVDSAGIFYATGYRTGLHRSTDAGITWSNLSCPGTYFKTLHVAGDGKILVQTFIEDGPPLVRYFTTRISTDGGASWRAVTPGSDTTEVFDYASASNGRLFAGTSMGVYSSSDGGVTWTSTPLKHPDVRAFAFNPDGDLFAGSASHGVFRSTDAGSSWSAFSGGLADSSVNALYCDPTGFLYAGTAYAGLFRTSSTTTAIAGSTALGPLSFGLEQNYPNPFNPSTTIRIHVGGAAAPGGLTGLDSRRVALAVYDLLGRQVALLFDGKLEPGPHEFRFDGAGLASGVYICRMNAGKYSPSQKMVLLR
jgi:photosystem II stability/assembly factor-like uncharacterized protein